MEVDIDSHVFLVKTHQNEEEEKEKIHIRSEPEILNLMFLLYLYLLQGIPIGLASSIPLILQEKKITYKQQSMFSLISWPFSLKLLWAPILDSFYWVRMGRRKSWLIPVQYVTGFTMLILSNNVSSLLGDGKSEPKLFVLFLSFLFLYFLAATQDIIVDGWAITLLSRKNVGHASTCNVIGMTVGYFIGKVVFLALESTEFCNTYLRNEPKLEGIVTISSFLKWWSYVFFITTTLILIFKKENKRDEKETLLNVKETYKVVYQLLCLPSMMMVIAIYMTWMIGFTLSNHAINLKLVESGVPKEHLALLDIPILPISMLTPIFVRKHVVGSYPLNLLLKCYPLKLIFGIIFAILLWWTRSVKTDHGKFPFSYYIILLLVFLPYQVLGKIFATTNIAFHAKISDPSIGGTYMTLLNTIGNLGHSWPTALLLWLIDPLTVKECKNVAGFSCHTKDQLMKCTEAGGDCVTVFDGYYILTAFCVIYGFLWLKWGKLSVIRLQQLPPSAWSY